MLKHKGSPPQTSIYCSFWALFKGREGLKKSVKKCATQIFKTKGEVGKRYFDQFKKNALLVGVTSLINWCTYFATLYFKTGYLLHTLPLKIGPANFFTMKMAMESIPLIHDSSLLRTNNYSTTWILGYCIRDIIFIGLTKKSYFFFS